MRRSKEDILALLLKSCVIEWQSITRLAALVNLPHRLLSKYLNHLASVKLVEIEIVGKRRRIHTTAKGLVALNSYRGAVALLNGQPARWVHPIEASEIEIAS